jgi:hypothetical protein
MSSSRSTHQAVPSVRLRRLIVVALVAAAPLLGGYFWLNGRIPRGFYWKAGVVFLVGLEFLYVVTATVALVAAIVTASLLVAKRTDRTGRGKLARALLMCASLAIALVQAEVASAIWLARIHRASAVPAGGLRRNSNRGARAPMPDSAALSEGPTLFPDSVDEPEIDIAIVGESSAEGVPYNRWVSIGAILQWQLEQTLPGRRVRLQVFATSGSTLEAQQKLLSRLTHRPEILLIYCGHNEITARVDPTRDTHYYVDEQLPTAWAAVVEQIEAISPVCG